MGKILVSSSHFESLCQGAKKLLLDAGHEIILHKGELPYMSFDEIAAVAPEIDGAIIGLDDWTEEVFRIAPKLKVVAKFGVGTDNIDKEAAKRYGIKVINAPGMNSNAVAELTVGMMSRLSAVYPEHWIFAIQDVNNALGNAHADTVVRFFRLRSSVWRANHFTGQEQGIIRMQRFVLECVKRGFCNSAGLQCAHQRIGVNDRTARCIH